MSYVKISDPSIVDLAAWQQVINVVNQHSDSIALLTNNFGASNITDFSQSSWESTYDPGSQIIEFGRVKVNYNDLQTPRTEGEGISYRIGQSFNTPFTTIPSVTATGQSSATSQTNDDIIITVLNVTTSDFVINIVKPAVPSGISGTTGIKNLTGLPISGYTYVSWVAIGPAQV